METLTNNILDQAKLYLESAHEFFPFGCSIDENNNIKPFSVYFDTTDKPKSTDVINELEKAVKKKLRNTEYKIAAIGINVFIDTGGESQQTSAIEIRTYTLDSIEIDHYKYFKKEEKYYFEKIK